MKLSKKAVLGSLLMMGVGSAFANTADMQVTGTIAPAACTANFAAGAVLDWGSIDPSTLGPIGTPLTGKRISYAISCDAPITIATSFADGRASSGWARHFFGLGLQDGVSVGGYRIREVGNSGSADGVTVDRIYSYDGGLTWGAGVSGFWYTNDDATLAAFAPAGTLIPEAYQNYVGRIQVNPYVRGTDVVDMSKKIDLDGLTTMTVRYL